MMIQDITIKYEKPIRSIKRVAFVYFCWVRKNTDMAMNRINTRKINIAAIPSP
ncbi:hypothetical protein D3C80_1166410 [compost metagenome]